MPAIYECDDVSKLSGSDVDAMEELLGDDILSTDWDGDVENPPISAWIGDGAIDKK